MCRGGERVKKMLAVLLALVLVGCDALLHQTQAPQPQVVTLAIPADISDSMDYTLILFAAKVSELSGDTIRIERVPVGGIDSYHKEEADLYLLSVDEVTELDDRLTFAKLPFLFESNDIMFYYLNATGTAISNSDETRERLDGEIMAVYEGAHYYFVGTDTIYPENAFGESLGVSSSKSYAIYDAFSNVSTYMESDYEGLLEGIITGQIDYAEHLSTDILPKLATEYLTSVEDLGHRSQSWWLLARHNETLDEDTLAIMHEAAAYTLDYQEKAIAQENDVLLSQLTEQLGYEDSGFYYYSFFIDANKYYQSNYADVNIPDDIWKDISSYVTIVV